MDFRQTTQPNQNRPNALQSASTQPTNEPKQSGRSGGDRLRDGKWFKTFNLVILIGAALIVALVALFVARGSGNGEYKYVDQGKYQAVFLNNGQVYFGNIDNLNTQYLRLSNIYYLTQTNTSSSTSSGNYSLVKLGCQQIHDPYDEMVINRDQVTFWENLQDNGKVVQSINQFKKQNPNGPDCSQVSNQTQASTTNNTTQGATTPTTSTGTTSNGSSTTTK